MLKVLSRVFKALTSSLELIPFYFDGRASVSSGSPGRESYKNILVFGYGGLGDVVFLLPLLQGLREWLPSSRITLVADPSSGGRELIEGGKVADEIKMVDWVRVSSRERNQINRDLMKSKFDVCLSAYTSPVRFFLPLLSKIPVRIGQLRKLTPPPQSFREWFEFNIWQEEFYRRRVFNRPVVLDVDQVVEHDIHKHLRMLTALGASEAIYQIKPEISLSPVVQSAAGEFLQKKGILEGQRLLGLSVGVSRGMEWKVWDIEKMAKLAEKICRDTFSRLVFFGSSSEQKLLEQFKKYFSLPMVDFVGQTTVLEMAALIKKCRLFISNDSGPSKLSMALGVPTAIVWGPSDRSGAGPWDSADHVSVFNGISCSPCYRVGLTKHGPGVINHFNCGHHGCLTNLSVEEAHGKILPWLNRIFR